LQETGLDSQLRFYCLYCNLLTDHVIAIQKDSTAKHKEKKKEVKLWWVYEVYKHIKIHKRL